MKAIILAGGRGTRLQSVIPDLPKPLAPVQGQPFIFILLRFLARFHIRDIYLSIGHLADQFIDKLSEFKKISDKVTLEVEQSALGTGGAVREICQNWPADETVLVLNGDTFFDFNLREFIQLAKGQNALALRQVPDTSRYGRVTLNKDRIVAMTEKEGLAREGLIYAGFCLLKVKDILNLLPPGKSSLETDLFPQLVSQGQLNGFVFSGNFIDIGIPEDYRRANDHFDFLGYLNKIIVE